MVGEAERLRRRREHLGAGDGAVRSKLLPQALVIDAVIQVLHVQIHTLEAAGSRQHRRV